MNDEEFIRRIRRRLPPGKYTKSQEQEIIREWLKPVKGLEEEESIEQAMAEGLELLEEEEKEKGQ